MSQLSETDLAARLRGLQEPPPDRGFEARLRARLEQEPVPGMGEVIGFPRTQVAELPRLRRPHRMLLVALAAAVALAALGAAAANGWVKGWPLPAPVLVPLHGEVPRRIPTAPQMTFLQVRAPVAESRSEAPVAAIPDPTRGKVERVRLSNRPGESRSESGPSTRAEQTKSGKDPLREAASKAQEESRAEVARAQAPRADDGRVERMRLGQRDNQMSRGPGQQGPEDRSLRQALDSGKQHGSAEEQNKRRQKGRAEDRGKHGRRGEGQGQGKHAGRRGQ